MPAPKLDDMVFEDAHIMFRNFAGREQQFNSKGDRNFCVRLDPDTAEIMKDQGWNVKQLKAREEGDEPTYYVQVAVNYDKGRPPRCVMISSQGRVDLGAAEVEIFDFADIKTVDLILNPYPWEVNGNKGVKAYLKSIFVTLNEDELELKYAGVQAASQDANVYNDEE